MRADHNYTVAMWAEQLARVERWMREDELRVKHALATNDPSLPFLLRIQSDNLRFLGAVQTNYTAYAELGR